MVVQNQNTKIFTEHGVTIASPLSIRGRTRWAELPSWAGRRRGRRAPSYSLQGHRHLCNKYCDVKICYVALKYLLPTWQDRRDPAGRSWGRRHLCRRRGQLPDPRARWARGGRPRHWGAGPPLSSTLNTRTTLDTADYIMLCT